MTLSRKLRSREAIWEDRVARLIERRVGHEMSKTGEVGCPDGSKCCEIKKAGKSQGWLLASWLV